MQSTPEHEYRPLALRKGRVVHLLQQRLHQLVRLLPLILGKHAVSLCQRHLVVELEVDRCFQANDKLHAGGQVLRDETQDGRKVKVVLRLLVWRIDDYRDVVRAFIALHGAPDGGRSSAGRLLRTRVATQRFRPIVRAFPVASRLASQTSCESASSCPCGSSPLAGSCSDEHLGHNLNKLYREYRRLYPELRYHFEVPRQFLVSLNEELFPEDTDAFHGVLDQRHRYATDRKGASFAIPETFDPVTMKETLSELRRVSQVIEWVELRPYLKAVLGKGGS